MKSLRVLDGLSVSSLKDVHSFRIESYALPVFLMARELSASNLDVVLICWVGTGGLMG